MSPTSTICCLQPFPTMKNQNNLDFKTTPTPLVQSHSSSLVTSQLFKPEAPKTWQIPPPRIFCFQTQPVSSLPPHFLNLSCFCSHEQGHRNSHQCCDQQKTLPSDWLFPGNTFRQGIFLFDFFMSQVIDFKLHCPLTDLRPKE